MTKIARTRVAQIVADRVYSGEPSKTVSSQIAAYLLGERRVSELGSLLRDVQEDWAKKGYVEVLAASAFPLDSKVKEDISRQMQQIYPSAKQVKITEVRDPNVIGGVRLSLANQQLDLSIAAKLNKFRYLTTSKGRTN